jgi:uncharacterized protein with PQ loop repeat
MITADILAYFGSICSSIAVLPQIIRIIKLKEAKALSYWFILLRIISFFSFMISIALTGYYLIASSYILIISANIYLAFLKFHYTKK